MSNPPNPLSAFLSYAYHHILIVCDGTQTAEGLAASGEITLFDHERAGDRFAVQSLPAEEGNYVVLINGMSDTQYTIRAVSWESVLTPRGDINGEHQFDVMAVDGEMTVQEPKGVRFLNTINNALKDLRIDVNGACFLLKTIFVGHRDDGRSEMITTIRPLLFHAYDITAFFDVTGAEYKLAFVGTVNGAARLPHISSVGDGFQVAIPKGGQTLAEFIGIKDETGQFSPGTLGQAIEEHYTSEWNKLKCQFSVVNPALEFDQEFKPVTYRFELDEQYHSYKVGTNEVPSKLNEGDNDATLVQRGTSMSIENLLSDIMRSSKDVMLEDKAEQPGLLGQRFTFKITSTLNTGPNLYEVVYHIQRFESVVVPAEQLMEFEPAPTPAGEPTGITFDYIFTELNVDIITFDIKMQMGMAFLQTLGAYNTVPGNTAEVLDGTKPTTGVSLGGNLQGPGDQQKLRRKPLFLGMSMRDPQFRNQRLPANTLSYNALLSRHAALENAEVRMTIHGNPQLLSESTLLPQSVSPTNTTPPGVIVPTTADRLENPLRNIMPFMHKVPGYVKVNIRMPSQQSTGSFDYPTDEFWYTGWYNLLSVKNMFDNGLFTQELEMYALPSDQGQDSLTEAEIEGVIKQCEDNTTDLDPGENTVQAINRSRARNANIRTEE